MGEPHDGHDQYVQHVLLGVDVVGEEGFLEAEPGVVDQQVDRAFGVGQPGLDAFHVLAHAEIGGQHLHGHRVRRAQVVGGGLEALLIAGDENEVVTAVGESLGEGQTDSGGATGDQGS